MVNRHRRTNQKRYVPHLHWSPLASQTRRKVILIFCCCHWCFPSAALISGSSHGGPSNSNTQKHHKQRLVNINSGSPNAACASDSGSQAVNEETIGSSTNSVAGSALPTIQSTSSNVITNSCFIASNNNSNNHNSNSSNLNNNGNNSTAVNLNLKVKKIHRCFPLPHSTYAKAW